MSITTKPCFKVKLVGLGSLLEKHKHKAAILLPSLTEMVSVPQKKAFWFWFSTYKQMHDVFTLLNLGLALSLMETCSVSSISNLEPI